MNNTKNIKGIIEERRDMIDKNGRSYLILKLDNGETVFVFSSKIKEERWSWLKNSQECNFTVEEGINGSNLLVDFEIEVNA